MVLLPGPVARDSGLISYRSDLYMAAGFLVAIGELPGLVAADVGQGSLSTYGRATICLFIWSSAPRSSPWPPGMWLSPWAVHSVADASSWPAESICHSNAFYC